LLAVLSVAAQYVDDFHSLKDMVDLSDPWEVREDRSTGKHCSANLSLM